MNIKTRINKLEKQYNPSEFCTCKETPKTEIRFPEKEFGDKDFLVADVCERCRKMVNKTIYQIVSV